jgi:hypothetical protein
MNCGNDWMIVQEDEQQNVKIIVVKVFAAEVFYLVVKHLQLSAPTPGF